LGQVKNDPAGKAFAYPFTFCLHYGNQTFWTVFLNPLLTKGVHMKIKSLLASIATLGLIASVPVTARAAVVYQSVPDFSLGTSTGEWCSDCYGGATYEPLEQFTLSSGASITGLVLSIYNAGGYGPTNFTFEVYDSTHSTILFAQTVSPTIVTANATDAIVSANVSGLNLASGTYWAGFIAPFFAVSGFDGGPATLIDTVPHTGVQNADLPGDLGFQLLTGAVPEPSTWAMMILGFAGLGFMAYRRKEKLVLSAA
jgi:hypothetical protein